MGDTGFAIQSRLIVPIPPLFTDRNLGRYDVPRGLRAAGYRCEPFHEYFSNPEEADVVWVPFAAQRGWICLTKDDELRVNELERLCIVRSRAHIFSLSMRTGSGAMNVAAILAALPRISAANRRFHGFPLYARLHRDGAIDVKNPWRLPRVGRQIGRIPT